MPDPTEARTALATRREQGGQPAPLPARIQGLQTTFAMALPKGQEAVRFVRDALTCLRTVRDLDKCDPESVLGALMTCAQLGLRPGVLGHAWPLPYWDNRIKGHRAQLVIGYQGLIDLAHRSGQIASLIARTVYERDTFEVDYGLADSLVHKPNLREDRGRPVAYYAIVKFTSGGHAFIVMTQSDCEAHRDRYAPRNKDKKIVGPWVDNFEAMALKTVIRQLAKYMPKSTDVFAEAIAADGGLRVDANPQTPASDVTGGPLWDGHVVDDRTEPVAELESSPAEPPAAEPWPDTPQPPTGGTADVAVGPPAEPSKPSTKQIGMMHALRNKLEAFAGNGEEAKAAFFVHIMPLLTPPREITTTSELSAREVSAIIDDLQAAVDREGIAAKPAKASKPAAPAQTDATRQQLRNPGEAASAEEAGY